MTTLNSAEISYPQVRRLIKPTETEIQQAIKVLVDAFIDDPFTGILLGGDLDLAPVLFSANVRAALIGGQVHVISLGAKAEDIVGVALWYPPGSSAFFSEEEREVGWNKFLKTVPDATGKWWTDYFTPTMERLNTNAFGPDYARDAWQLHIFGVMKAHHRKGYGKTLLRLAEDQAKHSHLPIVLETPTEVDVHIYQRLGYKIRAETPIKSDYGSGHVWLMFKENK